MKKTLTTLLFIGCIGQAAADEYHYRSLIIGDRAIGMGGAYTAISDDPSGLYYNPAGIVYSNGKNLSASVNAFNSSKTTYDDVLGGNDWSRSSSTLLPNFFGMVQPLGDGRSYFGFSYAVPDSVLEDQDQTFAAFGNVASYYVNVNNQDNTYKIGPSYAREINDKLSLGVTLYAHFRNKEQIVNQWLRLNNGDYEWSNSYYQSEETGYEPVLGLMWSPLEKLSLGLTIRQTQLLSSSTDSQVTCSTDTGTPLQTQCENDPTYGNTREPTITSSTASREMPLEISLGAAWFASNKLLISGDINYYGETSATDVSTARSSITNFALGMEYYFNHNLALRGGLYSNYANTPPIDTSRQGQEEHLDFYGMSLSLTRFTRTSSISVGITHASGSGDAQVFGDAETQSVSATASSLFLSTSYSY